MRNPTSVKPNTVRTVNIEFVLSTGICKSYTPEMRDLFGVHDWLLLAAPGSRCDHSQMNNLQKLLKSEALMLMRPRPR